MTAYFLNGRYMKEVPFPPKMLHKRLRGMELGIEPPRIKLFLEEPSPLLPGTDIEIYSEMITLY